MFILNFFRFLRGYVWFEASGPFVERFLNLTARNQITIWSGRKRGDIYTGYILAGQYRKLRAHAKKTGVRLRVVQKQGMPFHRHKYRKRIGILAGFLLFLGFICAMSQFLWRIEINGNERIDDIAILQALDSLGISPGSARRKIDVRDCERRMLLLLPDLSWAALNINGSTMRVEVSESILPPPMVDPQVACNILAKEAGQIVALNVFDGQAMVAVGDTVLPGDIVVSGITQDGRGQHLYRHASAQVIVETMQTLDVTVPFEQTDYVETGRSINRRSIEIFGIHLPFFLPFSTPSPYRVERNQDQLAIFSIPIPIALMRDEYILMKEVPITLTEEEARIEALEELANLQKIRLGDAEILDKKIATSAEENQYQMHAVYLCRMDVAQERAIQRQNS